MHLWRAVCCLSPQLGDLGAINEAVFCLYKVLSVPSAVQMIMLDVVLLPCCFRATPHFFPCKAKTKARMCFLVPSDTAAGSTWPGTPPCAMEGARTDQASLSCRAFVTGLREGQLPPALPSPCCSLAPCWGCGHMPKCCSAGVQPCQAPLVLLNWCAIFRHQSGKKSL